MEEIEVHVNINGGEGRTYTYDLKDGEDGQKDGVSLLVKIPDGNIEHTTVKPVEGQDENTDLI